MIGALDHDSALEVYTEPGTLDNEMNLIMNHSPGAGSIARPAFQRYHCAMDAPLLWNEIRYKTIQTHERKHQKKHDPRKLESALQFQMAMSILS